jgi:anti-sigma factor RsiW
MADIIRLRGSDHDEAQRLLPWFVNGTLVPDEIALVENHMAECAECRAELQAERELADAFASMPVDVDSSWSNIEQRLQAEQPNVIRPDVWWRRKVPVAWAVASPLAAAAAMALVFVNVNPAQPVNQEYRALGAPTVSRSANVVVLFEANSREKDMRAALDAADARLVDGPTETGAYLVLVDGAKRDRALKSLRDSNAIALAEPIDGPAHQ